MNKPVHKELAETFIAENANIWDRILSIQTELFFPVEAMFLNTQSVWIKAEHVLDAGCGNGQYTARLQQKFPAKNYTGIDNAKDLIEKAKALPQANTISFLQNSLADFCSQQKFDVIILRLVLQHLPDLGSTLNNLACHLAPKGKIIFIEPDLTGTTHMPETPHFFELLKTYSDISKGKNFRPNLENFEDYLAPYSAWKVTNNHLLKPSYSPAYNEQLKMLYTDWIALFGSIQGLEQQAYRALSEITAWYQNPNAESTFGIRCIECALQH